LLIVWFVVRAFMNRRKDAASEAAESYERGVRD
jgi:hypothetical protein